MKKADVISLLGEPEEGHAGSIWYGMYELFFNEETDLLTGIQNDHLLSYNEGDEDLALFQNDTFFIDPWFISSKKHVTYENCITSIRAAGMSFKENYEMKNPQIIFPSGVYLSFDNLDSFWDSENEVFLYPDVEIDKKESFILEGIRFYY